MQSKILSRRDLEFVLYELLDVDALTSRPRYADHSRETFDAALDTCERMATELFAPHYKKNDQNEPQFDGERVHIIPEVKQALEAFCQAGLMAAGQDYDLGGMQLPAVVNAACFAWFKGANVATAGYPFLTIGNANLLLAHGSKQQIDTYVRPMMEGRFFGTMCLSEPQAGSSLADIKTRAEPQPEGNYRLFGNKMWISAGEHELSENIVHLMLAKIPGASPGMKGISLFIVPKKLVFADGSLGERNDVVLAGITTRALLSGRDANRMLANASVYLEMLGHVVIAWIWLRQAVLAQRAPATAQGSDANFYRGKLQACQYFFRYELPKTAAQNELLRSLDPTCLEMRDQWF